MVAGLALAAWQSGETLRQAGPLPWGAFLVPLGLALSLLWAGDGAAPSFRVRVGWSAFAGALVALHVRPTVLPIHWGIGTWPTLARGWQLAILGGLSILALASVRWSGVVTSALADRTTRDGPTRGRAASVALAAGTVTLTVAVAWCFRTNVDLGDSWYVLEVAADGRERLVLFPRWPLTSAALGAAYRFLHPLLSARDTVALVSCLAGGVAVVIGLALVRRLHPTGSRWMAAAFLFSAYGVAQPFLGYVEVYPLALLALLLFLWAVVTVLQGAPLWRATLAGGLAVAAYVPLAVPVGAALLALGVASLRAGALPVRAWTTALLAGALVPGLAYGSIWLRDITGGRAQFVRTLIESLNLGWGGSWLIFVPPARLFARSHLLDVLNEWLLVDAIGLGLVAWGLTRGGPRPDQPATRVLVAMILPTIAYTFIMNPLRPPYEDWDLFAHASVLTALLGPLLLANRVQPGSGWFGALVIALLGLSAAHTLPAVLSARFAPGPDMRYPDVFAVEAFFRREGLRYALTDRSTHVYFRTLLRDVRSVQFADLTLGPLGQALDLTVTGAFVLVPETRASLLPNLVALGASYRVTSIGDYRVFHGFMPRSDGTVPLPRSGWQVTAGENPGAVQGMLDGNAGTRWTSGRPQRQGLAIEVDLGEAVSVAGLQLVHGRCCAFDYPRGLAIAVATEPGGWREVLVVPEVTPRVLGRLRVEDGRYRFAPEIRPDALAFRFPPTPGRWVRLTILRSDSRPWSVAELQLLGLADTR